ncbi:hypothetical protein NSA18_11905 [Pasteurella caecimuris]|uniref:hypothetical protein n=1 Tax=Rodentibacter caecimuris TaxID=1796644 RepID=UPI00214FE845|nr:hypothetical protein [Pasteurella caecimuris]MCR1838580.1 hypothetical protein [Pasteurella caecimuris]
MMSNQKEYKNTSQVQETKKLAAKAESPVLPNVAYPLKAKNNTNVSQQYFNQLAGDESARFLFNNSGLWHQGIHLRASKFPSSEFENDKICAIADGKLIAYKVDSEYKRDTESGSQSAVYSTGFFLLKHEVAYPQDNILTFYSLYRHTAKINDYDVLGEEILAQTKSADKHPVLIREGSRVIARLADGLTLLIQKYRDNKSKFDEVVWYQDSNGAEHKPPKGKQWGIFHRSYETLIDRPLKGIPLLTRWHIETKTDIEVKLDRPIDIKAGEILGLTGEYNQMGESGEKLLHLEVFTYDDIDQFKAKAEVAYKQEKEKKGIKDNFLYVPRGSRLYSIMNDEAFELEQTQVEIMVPLADVEKQSVKDKQNPKQTKTYYNVQPYLSQQVEHSKDKDSGIYVDDSHLSHGLLFPGGNSYQDQTDEISIFKYKIADYLDPKSPHSMEEKETLAPVFKDILKELDLAKEEQGSRFEAGKLKGLPLNPVEQRRLTGIIVRHKSEWARSQSSKFNELIALARKLNDNDAADRIQKRVNDLVIDLKAAGFDSERKAYYMHPLGVIGWLSIQKDCMPLQEAKEIALIISGAYEGKGGFASLSGNFDRMGMSWGIVQFNFGQNTLGPLLIDMRSKNSSLFNGCFSNDEDLSSLNKALSKGVNEQMNWAINMQNKYNSRWKNIFNKLAEIREFQEIQIEHAGKYIKAAIHIIHWMRGVHPSVMEKIEFKTFAALVDLAIQQGSIDKVKDIIKSKSLISPPDTQYAFTKLVVEERGSTASARWRADCISRRLGILNKKATTYSHSGYVAKRDNSKFSLIKEVYICKL